MCARARPSALLSSYTHYAPRYKYRQRKSFVVQVWQLIKWLVMLLNVSNLHVEALNMQIVLFSSTSLLCFFFFVIFSLHSGMYSCYSLSLIPVIFWVFFFFFFSRAHYIIRGNFSALFFIKYLIEHAFLTMIMAIICVKNHPIKS